MHEMNQLIGYRFLMPKPGSNYRQLFVNGRIRAEVLYRETVGPEPLSPEQLRAVFLSCFRSLLLS